MENASKPLKYMKGKQLPFILMSFMLFVILSVCFCSSAKGAEVEEPTNVRVGYFLWDGYQELDIDGSRSGYGYEYLQEIAKYAGWNYEYIEGSWDECLNMLEKGEIDVLTLAQYTEERSKIFDYSKSKIGTEYATLSVKIGNTKYGANDYKNYNGMVVGVVKGNAINEQFKEFSNEHNFTPIIKEYNTHAEIKTALDSGEIEAFLNNNFMTSKDEKILCQFSPQPFYCIVKKGNDKLLGQLNEALDSIQMRNSMFDYDLYKKYFASNLNKAVPLTNEEKEYVKKLGVVRAVATPNREPISYFENGEFKGIVADIMKLISKDTGIQFEFVETKTYRESLNLVKSGQVDILCNFYMDYNWAEENNLKVTTPYTQFRYSAVTRKGTRPSNIRVAVGDDYFFNRVFVGKRHPSYYITQYNTEEECLDAVNEGEKDVTYINTYVAEKLLRDEGRYNNLTANLISDFKHGVSIAVTNCCDTRLFNILDRSICNIDSAEISNIEASYTLFQPSKVTWKNYLYHNPVQVILSICVIFLLAIATLLYIIYQRYHYNKNVYSLAYVDRLTDLWNLNGFQKEVVKILKEHSPYSYALVSFDISHFTVINETYGREIGDGVIQYVANHLKEEDTGIVEIAHVKADHFMLLYSYFDEYELNESLKSLLKNMGAYEEHGLLIRLLYNCGIYLIQNRQMSVVACTDFAETARKAAKSTADPIVYFDIKIENQLRLIKEIEDSMEQALEEKEFMVYYQPKYEMRTKKIIGAEALVRWNNKKRGLMSPADFIPIFEKTGFIIELDFYVLEEVCKVIKDWIAKGIEPVPISVNQSRVHLQEEHYGKRLMGLIKKYEIPPQLIELELTESIFMDTESALELTKQMKAVGFGLSLDDFGSGYSSLNILNAVPLDVLKLDRELLQLSETSERARIVIKKIVEMANELEMETICEGVETQEQADFLISVGCYNAQGYLFAKPMPQESFLQEVDKN